jgi:hypothetical protein
MTFSTVFGTSVISFASGNKELSDISGHWAAEEVNKWTSLELAKGSPEGTFKPNDAITRAEFVAFVNRVFGYTEKSKDTFKDVNIAAWYADDIAKAVQAGLLKGDGAGSINPEALIIRQEAAVILARAFGLQAKSKAAADKFSDSGEIASWAKEPVSAMVENGYIAGRPGNVFAPLDIITRAETVKMIDNVMGELKNIAGIYTGSVGGNLVVNTAGVELRDMVIAGNLYLTEGIADGDVVLDGVIVKGNTFIAGGGKDSITIKNSSLEGTAVVLKVDGKIRIVAMGSTDIAKLQLHSGATLQETGLTGTGFGEVEVLGVITGGQETTLEGDFEDVSIEAEGININITGGTVQNLTVAEGAEDAFVSLERNATVNNFTADAGVTVTGRGRIQNATINASGVNLEKEPEKTTIAEDVTAIINEKEVSGKGATPPSSGGRKGGSTTVAVDGVSMEGVPVVGRTFTATPTPANATVNYQWQKADELDGDYTDIVGAVSGTYEITDNDLESYLRVKATGTGKYKGTVQSTAIKVSRILNTVKSTGHATIQSAVDSADAKDIIVVGKGTYEESITIDRSITLLGDPGNADTAGPGGNAPVLDGIDKSGNGFAINGGVSDVVIAGFEIKNAKCAITAEESDTSNITISKNNMHELGESGISVINAHDQDDHSNWTISNNIINGYSQYGIQLTNTPDSVIEDNELDATGSWSGIVVQAKHETGSDVNMSNIEVIGNKVSGTLGTNEYSRAAVHILAHAEGSGTAVLNDVTIEGNEITTDEAYPHLYVQAYVKEGASGGATITNVTVKKNSLKTLKNDSVSGVDAIHNWWGDANGPAGKVTGGHVDKVTVNPWYVDEDMTRLVRNDAGAKGVKVLNLEAAVDGQDSTVYNIELPYDIGLEGLASLKASDIVVEANDDNATVGTATTNDQGKTWTVVVTAEDKTTVVTYTINVTIEPTPINMAAIQGVTAPATGVKPVTTITETDQYTGAVTWTPEVEDKFAGSTTYTATITLTPKTGYTLEGVAKDFFTVAGATATNDANSGVITAVFPETAKEPDKEITGVEAIADINVDYGTVKADIELPEKVNVTLDDESTRDLDVEWDGGTPPYNSHEAGEYVFKGTLTLTSGIANTAGKGATVKVIVGEQQQTATPVITTAEQTVNSLTINIEGKAEANADIEITGGAEQAAGKADGNGDFSIEVSLNRDEVNVLSITAQALNEAVSEAATVSITHETLEASIKSVAAINGTVTITLEAKPTDAPKAGDFTATIAIDDGSATDLELTGFSYDGDITVTYNFEQIAPADAEQSVEIDVMQGDDGPYIAQFTVHVVGSISGTVTEALSGAALEDVTVSVEAGGITISVETASNGKYTLENVPVGTHTVSFDGAKVGYYLAGAAPSAQVNAKEETSGVDAELDAASMTGGGTEGNPYIILNVRHLQSVGKDYSSLTKHYRLGRDIDASIIRSEDGGKGFKPIGTDSTNSRFEGSFDGAGFTIDGLYINRPDEECIGLFGYTSRATIANVRLTNIDITGKDKVGGLSGYSYGGVIENSSSTGRVDGPWDVSEDRGRNIGGLIGYTNSVTLRQSYSLANVSGFRQVGGLVGYHFGGSIANSYSLGDVEASQYVGGLVGSNYGDIENSYSTGDVKCYSWNDGGGLVGYYTSAYGGTYDSYWDVNTSGYSTSDGGVGKTTAEMKQQDTFQGWDFDNIWEIDGDYPDLRDNPR